jgi:hypothetical protein
LVAGVADLVLAVSLVAKKMTSFSLRLTLALMPMAISLSLIIFLEEAWWVPAVDLYFPVR